MEDLMETQQSSQPQAPNIENIREVSRTISSRVEELSPGIFLTGAAASVAFSLLLRITGRQHDAQFVGQWAPTLLLLGLYTRAGRGVQGESRRYESGKGVGGQEMH
jgi:hypothetical protein